MKEQAESPLTVYYDKSCPLCRTEVEGLAAHAPSMRLVDCSAPGFTEAGGVPREAMMSRIHARDAQGRWLRGMDVFAAIYGAAGFRRAARLYGSRALRPLFDRLYPWIADHRQALSRLGLPRLLRLLLTHRAR
jgi:predicted DCC family thiol-disulfide oxidoreductase YuxK